MPVTPFHLGPGALLKGTLERRFSFAAFTLAQVITDLESLYFLLQNKWPVHRFLHTLLGATLLAFAVVLAGRPILNWLLQRTRPHFSPQGQTLWELNAPIGLSAATLGAFLGTYSHIFFDALMHGDMNPLAPFAAGNFLLDSLELRTIHLACTAAGVVGLAVYLLRRMGKPA